MFKVHVLRELKENGILYSLLTVILAVNGVDLGKTDSISQQLYNIDKRLAMAEYKINIMEKKGE